MDSDLWTVQVPGVKGHSWRVKGWHVGATYGRHALGLKGKEVEGNKSPSVTFLMRHFEGKSNMNTSNADVLT